jgi:flavin reductase (DIM6/NTAB) family NADH-FMN oxidoreductase RutF
MVVDLEARKKALQLLSLGVYVVGSRAGDETDAFTASWVTQTSFDPPLILVAAGKSSTTSRLIKQGSVFSLNILGDNQTALADHFSQPQKRVLDKMGKVAFREGTTGAPVLADALAYVECRVVQTIDSGDHTLFIGEVVEAVLNCEGNPLTLKETGWRYGG